MRNLTWWTHLPPWLLGTGLIAMGVVMTRRGSRDIWSGHVSRRWPSVQGRVLMSRIVEAPADWSDSPSWINPSDAEVVYEYHVAGQRFESAIPFFGARPPMTYQDALREVDRYIPGQPVTV